MKRTVRAVIMDALFDVTTEHDEKVAVANRVVNALYAEGYMIGTDARGTEWPVPERLITGSHPATPGAANVSLED